MWVDKDFYKDEWLKGDDPLIPLTSFPRWEFQAVEAINWRRVEIDEPPLALKRCVCAVAELLYSQHESRRLDSIKSETNMGYSWTAQDQRLSDADAKKSVRSIVKRYLAGTQLHNDFVSRGI